MLNSSNFLPQSTTDNTNNVNSTYLMYSIQPSHEPNADFELFIKFRLISSWISLVIVIIGLIGNLISFLILTSPKMRISTNVFLSSLCVSGFIALFGLLINSVMYELSSSYYYLFPNLFTFLCKLYPYIYPIITTFQMASILLTVCVSVNQFLYIYFSKLRNQSKQTTLKECQRAIKIVLLMYVISILYCIPYWLKFSYSQEKGLYETEIGQNLWFKKIVHFYLYLPIAYIIPFSILIFTNAYLIATIAIKEKRQQRLGVKESKKVRDESEENFNDPKMCERTSKSGSKSLEHRHSDSVVTLTLKNPIKSNGVNLYKLSFSLNKPKRTSLKQAKKLKKDSTNRSVTVMLIAVVFLFFICQFPVLILHIIQSTVCSTNSHKCNSSLLYKYSLVIAKLLLMSNLSFNFVCYCLFSKKFRTVLKQSLPNISSFANNFCLKFF